MLFYEPLFLFLFGPAVYLAYFFFGAARARRALILLAASIGFYGWSEPLFIFVVLASVALDLHVAQRLVALETNESSRRAWLALGVGANLAILVYYKYTGFLAFNLDALLKALTLPGLHIPQIALPIGVSFIVFEKITYLVDVYRGVTAPARATDALCALCVLLPQAARGADHQISRYRRSARNLPARRCR